MMLDWNQYREQLLKAIGDLGRLSPQTVRGYRELSDAGTKTARLDAKTRELIALAVGATRHAITTHVHVARKHGTTAEESPEALGVAIAVNTGAALVYSARCALSRFRPGQSVTGEKRQFHFEIPAGADSYVSHCNAMSWRLHAWSPCCCCKRWRNR